MKNLTLLLLLLSSLCLLGADLFGQSTTEDVPSSAAEESVSQNSAANTKAIITQTIKGTIVDKMAESSLPGVNVVLVTPELTGDIIGTSTDFDGNFTLKEIPLGRHSLRISFIGYKEQTIPNVLVGAGKEVVLHIELEEKISQLNEVLITAEDEKGEVLNDLATVSARSISMEEISRFSGSIQDPARMAQNYAGVSGAADDRNDIIIRGNSPTGVLWRMEGIDIPSPNHFATLGTTGGPVSMLNINNLRTSDFLSGAFPAEYGNATSGVFDLQLRNGNTSEYEFLGQIGFNGFEAGAEGPLGIGQNASFLANYRYSTLAIFNALGFDLGLGSAVPQYQDLTFKLNMPTEKAGRFSLWGIGGLSYIEFEAEGEGDNNLYSEEDENSKFRSNTGVAGLSHLYFFNEKTYSKLVLSVSGSQSAGEVEQINDDGDFEHVFGQDFTQIKYAANWKFNKKFDSRNRLTLGVMYDLYDLSLKDSVREDGVFETRLAFDGNASLIREYASWQHRFNDQLTLNTGLHFQQFLLNNSFSVEPRLGLSYELNDISSVNFGAGLHNQLQPISIYFQERLNPAGQSYRPNESLDFYKSAQVVLGYDRSLGKDWRMKTEVYAQYLYDIAIDTAISSFSILNDGADFGIPNRTGLENAGDGVNFGFELTLEKFFSSNYYLLFTSSLFDSRYRASDEVWRSTLWNGNYVFNFLAGKEIPIKGKHALTFDTKITYAGGRRYTPIDLESSIAAGEEILFEDRAFEDKYDDYFRTDLKIGFRINGRSITQTFAVDLQNLTGRDNIFDRGYSSSAEAIDVTYQRGFFPDVRYQILF